MPPTPAAPHTTPVTPPRAVVAVAAVAEAPAAAAASIENQARPIFPFTAIVGQEEMKLALILNVIDPKVRCSAGAAGRRGAPRWVQCAVCCGVVFGAAAALTDAAAPTATPDRRSVVS